MAPTDEQAYWEASFWEALESRDARMDGVFFYAVTSTGVYCRPPVHRAGRGGRT